MKESRKLDKKLLAYSTAAVAALVCGVPKVYANAIRVDSAFTVLKGSTLPGNSFELDVNGDGIKDFVFYLGKTTYTYTSMSMPYSFVTTVARVYHIGSSNYVLNSVITSSSNSMIYSYSYQVLRLAASAAIGSMPNAAAFKTGGTLAVHYLSYAIGNFVSGSGPTIKGKQGFIGLQFKIGAGTHFGWAEVELTDNLEKLIIHAYGYNNDADLPSLTDSGKNAIEIDHSFKDRVEEIFECGTVAFDNDKKGPPSGPMNMLFGFVMINLFIVGLRKMMTQSKKPAPSDLSFLSRGAAGLYLWRREKS